MKIALLKILKFLTVWIKGCMNPVAASVIISGVMVSMYLAGNNPMLQMVAIALMLFTGVFATFFLLFQAILAVSLLCKKPQ